MSSVLTTTDGEADGASLAKEDIYDVLRNRRRRLIIDFLQEHDGPLSVRELSERIGAIESDADPPPRKVKQSVYVALLQTHLPKLDSLGIVEYHAEGKTVRVAEGFDDVEEFLETVPTYGISQSEYSAGLAIVGLLVAFAAEIGAPILSELPGIDWAFGFLLLILGTSLYHAYRQDRSFVYRVRK